MARILGDAEVRRYFKSVLTPHEVNADIDLAIERARTNGFHFQAAELKDGEHLVGLIGLGRIPEATRAAIPSHPEVEIGWVFGRQFWGRGLAPEGARAWLNHAWSIDLPEVVAFTARMNIPSRRVMEKIGMTYDASDDYEHPSIPEGHPLRPHVVYRISNESTQALKA
jgi:RimJ/RimL family protein N-acetyltransferase